jgi:hypothetical protein
MDFNHVNPEEGGNPNTETPKVVFPSELEVALSIIDHYKAQITEGLKKIDEALTKLQDQTKLAESQKIAVLAQKSLTEAFERDLKKQLTQK